MAVVVGREVGFILVVAAVTLLAELAVKGLAGLTGGGGLGWGKGLVALGSWSVVGFGRKVFLMVCGRERACEKGL